jgi:uncharacterized protein YndB with AHSA1/START domain
MDQKLLAPVRTEVVVPMAPAEAYDLFTAGFDTWWIRSHNIGPAPLKEAVLELKPGGRWYEIDEDGSECDWGKVLDCEPPNRLLLGWQISADWAYDAQLLTEVEVTFTGLADGTTRVVVEHRNMERFGERAEDMQRTFGAPNGWTTLLARYAAAAAA